MRGLLIALLLLVGTSAGAQDWGQRGRGSDRPERPNFREMREHHQDFMQDLNLSDEQREKLKDLRGEKGAMWERMQEMRDRKDQLQSALRDKQVSDDEVRRCAKALSDEQQKLMDRRIESLIKMRQVLTPEQLDKILERIDERRQQFGGDHRSGPPRGGRAGERGLDESYQLP